MKYENPNNAAFFFDDGDFLNLEYVTYTQWLPEGRTSDSGHLNKPVLQVGLRNSEENIERYNEAITEREFKRLSDALRVYHSKL